MYLLVIILPLLSSIVLGLWGRFIGRQGSSVLSVSLLIFTWVIALVIFWEVCLYQQITSLKLYSWLVLDIYSIKIGLLFDALSSAMIVVVITISLFVHLYSTAYMSHDPHLTRFMSYLSLFTFCMLIFVTADNYVQLFMGWEGVGLCSYLLINFWYTRLLANKAALKAMIMNRIADVFFTIAILLLLLTFKTTDCIIIFNLIPFITMETYVFLGFHFHKLSLLLFFYL